MKHLFIILALFLVFALNSSYVQGWIKCQWINHVYYRFLISDENRAKSEAYNNCDLKGGSYEEKNRD